MRKILGFVGAALLVAATASAQNLLGDVQAERGKYGAAMTPSEVGTMLNAIAWKNRAAGWGLLSKNYGTNCPANGATIACDILVHAPSGQHFDVLIDAENGARPTWDNKGPIDMSRFLAPVDPGPSAPGAPVPPPTTGGADIGPVLARLDALERAVQALAASVPGLEQRVDAVGAVAAAADAKVDPLAARLEAIAGDLAALGARPIPVACSAALNLGATRIPISCRLQ